MQGYKHLKTLKNNRKQKKFFLLISFLKIRICVGDFPLILLDQIALCFTTVMQTSMDAA